MILLLGLLVFPPCDWRCLQAIPPTRADCRRACPAQVTACTEEIGDRRWCQHMTVTLCRLFGLPWCV